MVLDAQWRNTTYSIDLLHQLSIIVDVLARWSAGGGVRTPFISTLLPNRIAK